jgi:hypothetical protein
VKYAKHEAERLSKGRAQFVDGPLERALADTPYVDRNTLLAGLDAFHVERMEKVPSFTTYPEAKPWVEHVLAVEKALRANGLATRDLAVTQSLGHYLAFRGYIAAQPITSEKCRVAFDPNTDQGVLHIKNVDDPDTYWKPSEPMAATAPWVEPKEKFLVWDGVGSGMHIDDEPEEIFPISAREMYRHYVDDVPSVVEFLTRYKVFWGGQNVVIHDAKHRSVAIEKASYNHIEVFYPDSTGRSWCSGMATRDPNSPQGKYHRAKRNQYLELFNQPKDGPDQTFWNVCDAGEKKLGDLMRKPGQLKIDEVFELYTTPFPKGLNKTGTLFHPKQSYGEYTLTTWATVSTPTKVTRYRWQRGAKPEVKYPDKPEICVSVKPN